MSGKNQVTGFLRRRVQFIQGHNMFTCDRNSIANMLRRFENKRRDFNHIKSFENIHNMNINDLIVYPSNITYIYTSQSCAPHFSSRSDSNIVKSTLVEHFMKCSQVFSASTDPHLEDSIFYYNLYSRLYSMHSWKLKSQHFYITQSFDFGKFDGGSYEKLSEKSEIYESMKFHFLIWTVKTPILYLVPV
jgi:hypothetical protein